MPARIVGYELNRRFSVNNFTVAFNFAITLYTVSAIFADTVWSVGNMIFRLSSAVCQTAV